MCVQGETKDFTKKKGIKGDDMNKRGELEERKSGRRVMIWCRFLLCTTLGKHYFCSLIFATPSTTGFIKTKKKLFEGLSKSLDDSSTPN